MKEGWKTTEAWVVAIVSYLTSDVVMSENDAQVKMVALACGTLAAMMYIWSRTKVKEVVGEEVQE
jgi:hypothetical protein